jgi:hypothetical protein
MAYHATPLYLSYSPVMPDCSGLRFRFQHSRVVLVSRDKAFKFKRVFGFVKYPVNPCGYQVRNAPSLPKNTRLCSFKKCLYRGWSCPSVPPCNAHSSVAVLGAVLVSRALPLQTHFAFLGFLSTIASTTTSKRQKIEA